MVGGVAEPQLSPPVWNFASWGVELRWAKAESGSRKEAGSPAALGLVPVSLWQSPSLSSRCSHCLGLLPFCFFLSSSLFFFCPPPVRPMV